MSPRMTNVKADVIRAIQLAINSVRGFIDGDSRASVQLSGAKPVGQGSARNPLRDSRPEHGPPRLTKPWQYKGLPTQVNAPPHFSAIRHTARGHRQGAQLALTLFSACPYHVAPQISAGNRVCAARRSTVARPASQWA
jgi:hypothetical protein